jgi:hypothetical protein
MAATLLRNEEEHLQLLSEEYSNSWRFVYVVRWRFTLLQRFNSTVSLTFPRDFTWSVRNEDASWHWGEPLLESSSIDKHQHSWKDRFTTANGI